MKVYIITGGECSEYHIDTVFTDKSTAERNCAFLNDREEDVYKIEEYDSDTVKTEAGKEVLQLFCMETFFDSGDIYEFQRGILTYRPECYISNFAYSTQSLHPDVAGKPMTRILATLPKDTTDEQAKKIMLDRIAQYKAEMAGVV